MFRRFRPPFEHCTRHLASFSSLYDASTSMTPRGGREISKTSQAERRVGFLFLFGFFSPASMMKQFFFSLFIHLRPSFPSLFSLLPPYESWPSGSGACSRGGKGKEKEKKRRLFSPYFRGRERERESKRPNAVASKSGREKKMLAHFSLQKKKLAPRGGEVPIMTSAGGLLAAAAAASRLLRRGDEGLRRLPSLSRALTADAAEALQVQQQQEEQRHRPLPSNAAADESSSAHARRLREMEASTSSSRRASWIPTAAEFSARLRNERRSPGEAPHSSSSSPSSLALASAPLPSPDDSDNVEPSPNPPLRDWRDALEAAKMLEPRGEPLIDTFG